MDARLEAAFGAVDRVRFCLDEHGNPLPQTSAPHMIERMLDSLRVRPGARVLEIGTGSGYSTALLAELAGPQGSVTSLDIDPALTARATMLLSAYRGVHLENGNGRHGWMAGAPYDRLVAWCSVVAVPAAWVEQTRPAAILVVPRRRTNRQWIGVYRRGPAADLVELERLAGAFVPLTSAPYRPWER